MGVPARYRLRDLLRRLIREQKRTTAKDLVEANAIARSPLYRALEDDGEDVTLATLDTLAHALNVEPWQLIHPDADVASFSPQALKIARAMDDLVPEVRERAYARFVQDVDFANLPTIAERESAAGDANAPGAVKPIQLRKVPK